MSNFVKYIEPIPEWALCYIVNGDATGLTDDEIKMVDEFLELTHYEIITPCDLADPCFRRFPSFGMATTCIDCDCLLRED